MDRLELPEEEAEHLVRVLRLGVGDAVDVFNGHGGLWRAEVIEAGKKSVVVRPLEPLVPAKELDTHVTLVLAVLKGDKMDDVVRDAVMLGVAAIQPVISGRTEVSPAALARSSRADRWRRIAVSSAKQCGRAVVPEILDPMPLAQYWAEPVSAARVMCVEPSAALGDTISVDAVSRSRAVDLIIGPEGGWAVSEIAAAHDAGAMLMSLGARTLRADAMPIIAMTALLTTWGDLT